MVKHSHKFVENYQGAGAFGWDRATDEETIIFYLQKFSDDKLMAKLVKKLSGDELEKIYIMINKMLKNHLSESEYHNLFLKDNHHHKE